MYVASGYLWLSDKGVTKKPLLALEYRDFGLRGQHLQQFVVSGFLPIFCCTSSSLVLCWPVAVFYLAATQAFVDINHSYWTERNSNSWRLNRDDLTTDRTHKTAFQRQNNKWRNPSRRTKLNIIEVVADLKWYSVVDLVSKERIKK